MNKNEGTTPNPNDLKKDLMDLVEDQTRVEQIQAMMQARRNKTQLDETRKFRFTAIAIVVGIIIFFVKGIYTSVNQYPNLKRWWENANTKLERYHRKGSNIIYGRNAEGRILVPSESIMRGSNEGASANINIYQVCTTVDYPMVASFMQLLLVWKSLDRKGALFIRNCIQKFEVENADTMMTDKKEGYLNLLHFQGSCTDYMKNKFLKNNDPGTFLDSTLSGREITKESAWESWVLSALNGNIWYDIFPKNADDFAKVPIIDSMIGSFVGSGSAAELNFANLMNGGLINVARQETDMTETANQLFSKYFGSVPAKLKPDCDARKVDGAINGALGLGMVAPSFIGAIPMPAIAAMTLLGGAAGYAVGGNASEEICENT